jgi:putative membrane protein
MWWNDPSWMGNQWPMPWMFFGPVLMIIFIAVCIVMMMYMMRGHSHRRSHSGYALDILKERFARGEINQAEYEERRQRLLEA